MSNDQKPPVIEHQVVFSFLNKVFGEADTVFYVLFVQSHVFIGIVLFKITSKERIIEKQIKNT